MNSAEYYSRVTIKTILKILCDTSLRPHHDLAIETLQCILGTLKVIFLIKKVFLNIKKKKLKI